MDWAALPLFPLARVLFPGGMLTLRVFEVRYLDMISKAHRAQTPFGVVTLKTGSEVRQPPVVEGQVSVPESFFNVGTLATITQYETPQPGLIHIQCRGGERFHLMRSEQSKGGLWMAQAFAFGDDPRVEIPSDLQVIASALKTVHDKLLAKDGASSAHGLFIKPFDGNDCAWVANRWCELLRLPLELRQRLMQLDNPLMRLELVGDLLRRQGILPQ